MEYSLSYIEGNENPNRMPSSSYDTIQDCVDWADENNIDYYLLSITEWDDEDIIAQVNLQAVVDDNERESLSKYQTY
jgi:hypothetical protein